MTCFQMLMYNAIYYVKRIIKIDDIAYECRKKKLF
jgi:hypothetical protein